MLQNIEELDSRCFSQRDAFINLVKSNGQRIIDIGCGDGRLTLQHFADAAVVLGMDKKQDEIDIAAEKWRESADNQQCRADFVCDDIVAYPLNPSTFDMAIFLRSF